MDLILLTPESRTIISDALHNYGTSWTSDEYEAGTDFTLATIEHHESRVVDTGYVASMDNSPVDSLYSTHCSGAIVGQWSHGGRGGLTFEVNINVKLKEDYFEIVPDPEAIHHMESAAIILIARDTLGGEVLIPGWTTVTIAFSPDSWEWGENYGTLEAPDGSQGWEVSGSYNDARGGKFKFIANNGGLVCNTAIVGLRAWASDVYPAGGKGQVTIAPTAPDRFEVDAEQDTIDYLGTTTIHVQAKDASNNDMCWNGRILVSASSTDYGHLVSYTPAPAGRMKRGDSSNSQIKMRISSTERPSNSGNVNTMGRKFRIEADTTVVANYIDANQGNVWYTADGVRADSNVTVVFSVAGLDNANITGRDSVVVRAPTILLGETKYYYATEDNGTLTIHETSDPSSNSGESDVIFEDLIIADDAVNNDKIGAYWDYLKPDGTGLDDGMIRVIGRYWKPDVTYKVKLHAVLGDEDASIDITVKKPRVLGDPQGMDLQRHSVVTDVFGVFGTPNLNLDSLIIKYAGENGILPQLIKGQMDQESNFKPSWRYEPMRDISYQEDDELRERFFPAESPFVKSTDHPIGTGVWPYNVRPPHSNVFPVPYNNSATTIGGYIADNWDKYKRKGKLGEPDSILSSADLTQRFKELYKPPTKLNKETVRSAKQTAYDELTDELKNAKLDVGKRYNRTAQTRIVTSYGFTQLMYTMVIDEDGTYYKETDGRYAPTGAPYMFKLNSAQYPEKLNEQNLFMPI